MPPRALATLVLAALGAVSAQQGRAQARAQAPLEIAEQEPNGARAEATVAACLRAGDALSGTTTGETAGAGDASSASVDTFRVRTCPLPLGIYRHELRLTTDGAAGHTGSLRANFQTTAPGLSGQVDLASDVPFQTSWSTTTPPRANAWYGFGRGEELHYRVTGTSATTSAYRATLATTPIEPVLVQGSFAPGTIVITTQGQGHSTDTEVHLFDGALRAIDDASSDDESVAAGGTGTTRQSRLVRALAQGEYYLAIGRFNVATSDNSPADDDFRIGNVLDLAGTIASSTTASGSDVSFQVSDAAGNVVQVAAALQPGESFGIAWFQLQVGAPRTPATSACAGDGSGAACPCGNTGASGSGCANAIHAQGGLLVASGIASVAADTFVLRASGMPNGPALYAQSTGASAQGAGVALGDGLRCVAGSVVRLSIVTNAGGASRHPAPGATPISVAGGATAGAVRWYQVWYRDAAPFCTSATFNLTNGLRVVWAP